MVVALVCALVCIVVVSRRYAWWRATVDFRHPRILMYHMVQEPLPGAKFNKLRVSPSAFEAQLRWLSEQGWHFAKMSDLLTQSLPDKTVILTFDDGYSDNLENADPIMAKYDACATLYLVEDRFDRDWSTSKKAHHDSGELMREPKLHDDQIAEMLQSGRWEIGGHTRTHANLSALDDDERRTEIVGARDSMARHFGTKLDSFAYPFGIYSAADVAMAREAGYSTAVTTEEGIATDVGAQALELPRIKVSGKDSMLAFRLRLRTGRRGA